MKRKQTKSKRPQPKVLVASNRTIVNTAPKRWVVLPVYNRIPPPPGFHP